MTSLTNVQIREVIRNLIAGGNHRSAVFDDINRRFLERVFTFFQEVTSAKQRGKDINAEDWYITEFMQPGLDSKDQYKTYGIRSGMPRKTIEDIYGRAPREIVIKAGLSNIKTLRSTIDELVALDNPKVMLTIKSDDDGVELTVYESLIVINAIAVMRQSISGGTWSALGKNAEVPLMQTLCRLFQVDPRHYRSGLKRDGRNQVDFMLTKAGVEYRCEVKLNGPGNPESVTTAIGRDPRVVIAGHVSDQNREKLDAHQIKWVDLSDRDGYQRFGQVLQAFGIEHVAPANLDQLDGILDELLPLP